VAYLAEAANHHPDILIQWDTVTLTLSTHSAGGLTGKDMQLAAQISNLG
jgi:4a-hydroxytetrahydrobiopterin dehydratase